MSGATWTLFLVAEGPSDERRLRVLFDALIAEVDWVDDPTVFYAFRGLEPGTPFTSQAALHRVRKAVFGDRPTLRFGAGAGRSGGERQRVRWALELLAHIGAGDEPTSLLVWCRDEDAGDGVRQAETREVLQQTRPWDGRHILAMQNECGEAWTARGLDALPRWAGWSAAERRRLGFDPSVDSHRLSHKENVPSSAKDLLDRLGLRGDDEAACLLHAARRSEPDLTGLTRFVDDVRAWLQKHS